MFLYDAHMRIERIGLEHHGDAALGGSDSFMRLPPIGISPPVIVFEPGDHAQQGGLAAAGGPDEHHEFAAADLQIDTADDLNIAETLVHIAQGKCGHVGVCPFGRGCASSFQARGGNTLDQKALKQQEEDEDRQHRQRRHGE